MDYFSLSSVGSSNIEKEEVGFFIGISSSGNILIDIVGIDDNSGPLPV